MASPSEPERLRAGYTGRMLFVLALGSMIGMVARLSVSPLLPTIIDDLSISPVLAGIALSVMWALSALVQFPSGRLSDDLSRKTVLIAGLGVLILASGLLLGATTYLVFLFAVAILGVGAGLYLPTAVIQLTDLFANRRGQALGINNASINLGGVFAAGLATVTLAVAVWRMAYLPLVVGFGVVLVLMHRWNREPYVVRGVDFGFTTTGRRLLGRRKVRWVIAAAFLAAFTWQGMASFLPTYLQVEKGFSPALANNAFAVLFIVGAVSAPIAGGLGDRFDHLRIVAGLLVLGALGTGLMVWAVAPLAIGVGVVVASVGLMGFWPVITAYLMHLIPRDSRGGEYGATRSIYIVLGSLGPTYVGFVAERLSYSLAFTGFIGCFAGALAITGYLTTVD